MLGFRLWMAMQFQWDLMVQRVAPYSKHLGLQCYVTVDYNASVFGTLFGTSVTGGCCGVIWRLLSWTNAEARSVM